MLSSGRKTEHVGSEAGDFWKPAAVGKAMEEAACLHKGLVIGKVLGGIKLRIVKPETCVLLRYIHLP